MEPTFTIIDSFEVTESLAPQLDGLAFGKWYVLEDSFPSMDGLPPRGSWIEVQVPRGECLQVVVAVCEVGHGTAALLFIEPDVRIPRLSKIRRITGS